MRTLVFVAGCGHIGLHCTALLLGPLCFAVASTRAASSAPMSVSSAPLSAGVDAQLHAVEDIASSSAVLMLQSATQDELPVARKPDVTKLFPGDRGAQRMMKLADEPSAVASVARLANDRMPDWTGWWSIEDVCATLTISLQRRVELEALLVIRGRERTAVIEESQQSKEASKYFEALREADIGQPDADPDLETRASLAQQASRFADDVFEKLLQVDRRFADSATLLVAPPSTARLESPPSESLLEQTRRGVQRLRCFDPALSPMTLMNTGVDLTVHVVALLGSDARDAIVLEVTAWQTRVAGQLDLFEQQRVDLVKATAAAGPLEERLRRLTRLKERGASIREDLLATMLRSARSIALLVAANDAGQNDDRAREWLRSVYRACAPTEIGLTAGDVVLESALKQAQHDGTPERGAALTALGSRNLRECAELEGTLIDAAVRTTGEMKLFLEFMAGGGPVREINARRFVQADAMLKLVVGVMPADCSNELKTEFEVARRARASRFMEQP